MMQTARMPGGSEKMLSQMTLRLASSPDFDDGRLGVSKGEINYVYTHSSRRSTLSVTAQEVKACATSRIALVIKDKICN